MPAYMAPHQRSSSSYSSVSTRNIHRERDLHGSSKKLVVTAKKRSPPRRSTLIPPASEKVTAGTTVSVRTRVGKLPDGRQLVLWLSAVVVSAAEEGYLTVVYKGDFHPPEAVRVARKETKKMPPAAASPAPASTAASSAPAASSKNAATPRPTTAGKSVAVLKRVYPEAF